MGVSAILAGVTLLLAAGLLLTFFVTENETADRMSGWFFMAFYLFMGWTVVDVHRFYVDEAAWVWVITAVALVVLALLLVSQLLITFGALDYRRVAIASTVGFIVIMLWMLAVSIVILTEGMLPAALGWFGVAVIGLAIVVVAVSATDRELMMGEKTPGPLINAMYGLVLLGLTAWLIWLGIGPTSMA